MLPAYKYLQAIELTQVVSIDLICKDQQGRVLVGKRKNEPARGTWFVPGGRVYKGETPIEAIPRLSMNEIGFLIYKSECKFIGVNDHIYNTNFQEEVDEHKSLIPTHYVCLAYEVTVDPEKLNLQQFDIQHDGMRWMTHEEIMDHPKVHPYTRKYFTGEFNWAQ